MITVFMFPEFFEPEESLIPGRLKRPLQTAHTQAPLDPVAPCPDVPQDFPFLVNVLKKRPDLRIALFRAMKQEGFVPFLPLD
jgi:hypothetical protein